MKKKLDDLTKYKLIYSGEILFFAVLLTVLGFLFAFNIIPVADWKIWFFTILTLIGGTWVTIDFFWTIFSEKKRKKNGLLDKCILLPEGICLIICDIYALINLAKDPSWKFIGEVNYFQVVITCAIFYVAVTFYFEAIFHYFKVHPMVYEMIEEEKKEQEQENNKEEKKEDTDGN